MSNSPVKNNILTIKNDLKITERVSNTMPSNSTAPAAASDSPAATSETEAISVSDTLDISIKPLTIASSSSSSSSQSSSASPLSSGSGSASASLSSRATATTASMTTSAPLASLATPTATTIFNSSDASGNNESDMITLQLLTSENKKATSILPQTSSTTTPLTTKKNYFTKRPVNLNLQIHAPTHPQPSVSKHAPATDKKYKVQSSQHDYAETENATLSNTTTTDALLSTNEKKPLATKIVSTSSHHTNRSSFLKTTTTPRSSGTYNVAGIAATHGASVSASVAASTSTSTATPTATTTSTTPTNTTMSPTETIFPHEQYKRLKKLDIGFDNICYSAKVGFFKRETKHIINGITGNFKSGELSAIVGPSGAGKSTFLNILSAYTPYGYSGDVTVNGHQRDIKAFKPNVAFITQDTSLQPYLTVKEAMHFSANLKIGAHMTSSAKKERVRKILEAIGMYENRHTRTGKLSGGQKKRLAIALELVNNPPVLILDEPTSGLDSSTSNQCISLLKKLAMEGRTVICTIHQPSALTFEMFDHLYAIAEGYCIYSGGTRNLVPFLAECGLNCPESYNPADYLMEIATDDYGKQNPILVEKIQNGRNEAYRQAKGAQKAQLEAIKKIDKMMASGLMTPVTAPVLTASISISDSPAVEAQPPANTKQLTPINEMSSKVWNSSGLASETGASNPKSKGSSKDVCKPKKPSPVPLDPTKLCSRENIYATPFYRQLSILLIRTFLILWRDKSLTTMRFVIHFLTALLIGFLYFGIGNDAGNAMNNFRYVFYTIMFIMYCAFSSILINFPLEFPIVSREHFNRWYSLRAYYVAITLADIPIQLICTNIFILITYFLTDQPMELIRIVLFSLIIFLTALVGQSIGLAVGASLSVQLGAILGPFFICPFLAFSGFFLQEKDAPHWLKWLFSSSFLKYSLDGAMLSIFGFDRPKLDCHQMYCHFNRPKYFLKYLDMQEANYLFSVIFLLTLFIGLRIIAFYIMSFRLRLFR